MCPLLCLLYPFQDRYILFQMPCVCVCTQKLYIFIIFIFYYDRRQDRPKDVVVDSFIISFNYSYTVVVYMILFEYFVGHVTCLHIFLYKINLSAYIAFIYLVKNL